jgi:predicted membrane-bound dolichyl-phosphate-mannose-protein mannosyltransferase
MNERIKELREQALRWSGENVNRNLYSNYEIEQKEYEKFAELIVRECAKVILAKAADYPDTDEWHDWTNGMDQAQADIVVHFGVEE